MLARSLHHSHNHPSSPSVLSVAIRHLRLPLVVVLALIVALAAFDVTQAQQPSFTFGPPPQASLPKRSLPSGLTRAMRRDATLRDVTFSDSRHGWAVGDRGAIWHTRDGGHRWELQESGVSHRLNCVEFIDANVGWAAGGWTDPVTHVSRSLMLFTSDGGKTWTRSADQMVGEYLQLHMSNGRRGWAITRGSAVFPGGVFRTEDGARGWTPIESKHAHAWQTGDLSHAEFGLLAGAQAQLAFVRPAGIKSSRTHLSGLRSVRAMRLLQDQNGILVGDGGLIMQTPDGGGSWQKVPSISPAAAEMFDWRTIATHESHIWIAGQPGTYVLHSHDDGKTWQWHETGQTLPLRALHFLDERNGWAVGALGNILATRDGGRSWQAQQGEATRLAWLGVFADADAVPLELVARLSAGEGYYGGTIAVARRDFDPPGTSNRLTARAQEAARLTGAGENEQLWQFPVRQAGLKLSSDSILEGWEQLHEQGGLEELQEQLVLRIRTWRPTVIITQSPSDDSDAVASVLRLTLLQAVQRAADERQYPSQINDLKLVAWRVPKVYSISTTDRTGRAGLTTAQFIPRLGKSLHGFATAARGLLDGERQSAPIAYRYESLIDDSLPGSLKDDLFVGRHLPPGSEARRAVVNAPAIPLTNLRRLADRRRALPGFLAQASQDRHGGTAWQKKVTELLRDLDRKVAAEILYQLAMEYAHAGHTHLAAESLTLLSELYLDHPLASAARLQLLQHFASSEVRLASRQRNQPATPTAQPAGGPLPPSGLRTAAGLVQSPGSVRQAGLFEASVSDDAQAAVRWASELKGLDEVLYTDPRTQLALAAAHRKAGQSREAQRALLSLTRSRPHDAWHAVATRELALIENESGDGNGDGDGGSDVDGDGSSPDAETKDKSPARVSVRTKSKPFLDGKLDDACWQVDEKTAHRRVIPLRSAYGEDTAWPTVAMLSYDEEYLYLAVRCSKAPGVNYEETDAPRQRDRSLAMRDRVTLLLDVDRDYATHYEFTVDARGWIADRIGNNVAWNPEWFVANAADETTWTCEAAIRWSELSDESPTAGTVWAAGLQRTLPGVGFQSVAEPAAVTVQPEGFWHLRLE